VNKKKIKCLLDEVERLEARGVISSQTCLDIQTYYQDAGQSDNNKSKVLTVFGILGGLLTGGGIILLLAHNWSSLNRIVQSALFLGPLLTVQIIGAVLIMKKNIRHIWHETVGIIYFLIIGAAVAMISRIYHIGGDLESFLLIWAIGGLPVVYFLTSDAAAVLYLASLTAWAAAAQLSGGTAVLYWPLLAAVVPRLIASIKGSSSRNYRIFIWQLLITAVTVSLGITIEKVVPGLWILIYFSFFVMMFLSGDLLREQGAALHPVKLSGLLGVCSLTLLLGIRYFWKDVGFDYLRDGHRYHRISAVSDYIILGVFVVIILSIILSRRVKLTGVNLIFLLVLVAAAVGFLFPDYGAVIFHVYAVLFGYSLTIKKIVGEKKKLYMNIGLLVVFLSMLIHLFVYKGFSVYWFFIYSCFLSIVFIRSGMFSGRISYRSDKIWKAICLLTGLALVYGLSFLRFRLPLFPDRLDFTLSRLIQLALSAGILLYFMIPFFGKSKKAAVIVAILPLSALFVLLTGKNGTIFYNLYLLTIGIVIILNGISNRSMKIANGGIFITIVLIVTRFFDIDMSFSIRGIVFILLGIFFILFNVYFAIRLKREELK